MDEKESVEGKEKDAFPKATGERVLQYNVPISVKKNPNLAGIDMRALESSKNRLQIRAEKIPIIYVNLSFVRNKLESRFTKYVEDKFKDQLIYLHLAFLFFPSLAIMEYMERYNSDGHESSFLIRTIYCCISIAAILVALVSSAFIRPHNGQVYYSLIYCVYAAFIVASDTVGSDDLRLDTSAITTISFLVAYHLLGKMFVFKYIALVTMLVDLLYIIMAPIYRRRDEHFSVTAVQVISVMIASIFLCYSTHRYELHARKSFILGLKAEHDKHKLEQEKNKLMEGTNKIREDIYKKLIEKIDSPQVEISSPAEMMIRLLKKLQEQVRLPPRAFQMVNKIITILATSNDIFKPQIQRGGRSRKSVSTSTSNDIHSWILDLVQVDRDPILPLNNGLQEGIFSATMTHSIPTAEQKVRDAILSKIDEYNFDMFEVDTFTGGQPLLLVTISLFHRYDMIRKFNIDAIKLKNFITEIEAGYNNVPYHNSIHAADVLRSVHYFIKEGKMENYMKPLEILASLIGSAIHDFEHPGVNNNFLIATNHEYALTYNDRNVLENHHIAAAYRVLQQKDCNFLADMKADQRMMLRKNIIQIVLSTDLANHFEELGKFKTSVESEKIDKADMMTRNMITKIMVKCGDLGHATKHLDQHMRWTKRITEEMFSQGDKEKILGIKPKSYMDREVGKNIAKSQLGFLRVIVQPLFLEFIKFVKMENPKLDTICIKQLEANIKYWENEAKHIGTPLADKSEKADIRVPDKKSSEDIKKKKERTEHTDKTGESNDLDEKV